MTFYAEMAALVSELAGNDEFGRTLTIRGEPTAADPVTGSGGSDGSSRSVQGKDLNVDNRTFPETLAETGDRMLVIEGDISVGEVWVDGSNEWVVVDVRRFTNDSGSVIAAKALVRG